MRSHRLEEVRNKSLLLFYTDQDAEVIAKDLKISIKTIRRWWVASFGKEAVQKRGKIRNIASNQRRGLPEGQVRLCKCGQVCPPNLYTCLACHNETNKRNRSNMSPETRVLYSAKQRIRSGKYYELHPEKYLVGSARRRAVIFNVPFNITAEDIKSCIPKEGRCPITKLHFKRGEGKVCQESMTLDRTIPELGYVPGNVLVVSHLANIIKSNCTDPTIFRRIAEYVEAANVGQSSVLKFLSDAVAIRSYYPTNYYYAIRPERTMVDGARKRAKEHGVPFAIKAKDIRDCFPEDGCCPITRLFFERGERCGPQSMSLDRIIPELGYIPGNISVISHLANTIKQNCTDPEIFRRIADYLESAQRPTLKRAG